MNLGCLLFRVWAAEFHSLSMNQSKRSLQGASLGLFILVSGFILLCHADFWTITNSDGVSVSLYTSECTDLAHLLMYSGAVLSVLSAVVWMRNPPSQVKS